MAFIPVPAAAKAEMVYSTPGGGAINTLWFTTPVAWDTSSLSNLATILGVWWAEDVQPLQGAAVSLEAIRVTSQISDTAPGYEYNVGLPIAGGNGANLLPMNVTAAVSFLTAFRGRNNRGRNYIIGLVEGAVTNDKLTPTSVLEWRGAYLNLFDQLDGSEYVWVVASRYNGVNADGDPIPRASGQTTPVTGVKLDDTIDSQRRRLTHRGR